MKGKYNHIEWLELENGIMTECAIMKRSPDGHIWFIPVNPLDIIDRQRILNIVRNRNSSIYELWDLMSNITLGNGINALAYFNQLVKVRTPLGQILPFGSGFYGVQNSVPNSVSNEDSSEQINSELLNEAVSSAKTGTGRARR